MPAGFVSVVSLYQVTKSIEASWKSYSLYPCTGLQKLEGAIFTGKISLICEVCREDPGASILKFVQFEVNSFSLDIFGHYNGQ